MIESQLIRKIEEFIYAKPRSIQEVSFHIGKSWRTADRYVEHICKEFGTIATRTFRGGSRGALKIVYWASMEKVSGSVFQEMLETHIISSKKKEDFSAFDIFQHVPDSNKRVWVEEEKSEELTDLKSLADLLSKANRQLLVLSGNLSFINLKNKEVDLFKIIDKLVSRGVSIKVVCRVDIAGDENIEHMLSLNFKHGKELIEIRHREHPVRGFIVDNSVMRLKEIKEPTGKTHELKKKLFIFYIIKDKEWIDWLSRIFWKMFSSSIDAKRRIVEIRKLKH